jgi:hypothetical protein
VTGGAYQRIAHSMRRPMAARPDAQPNLREIVLARIRLDRDQGASVPPA